MTLFVCNLWKRPSNEFSDLEKLIRDAVDVDAAMFACTEYFQRLPADRQEAVLQEFMEYDRELPLRKILLEKYAFSAT